MNVYLPNKRLPSTYQKVEYIQSSGTQYINTWFITTPNTKVELDFQFTSLVQSACSFWNSGNWPSNTWATFCWYLWDSATHFKLWIADWTGATDVWNNTVMNSNTNRYVFVAENWKATIYNTAWVQQATKNTVRTISQNCKYSSFLFAAVDEDTGVVTGQCSWRLYLCKIYNGWILNREFVPCYRKSDNVIWLYDLVNNQFYTNAWSWTFSKGNDVTMSELKNAYIGEVLHKYIDVRWKTLAQIQTEWWTFHNNRGSYTLDSNWISIYQQNSQALISYHLSNSLTTNNKITFKVTGNCTSAETTSWYWGVETIWLFNNTELWYRSTWVYGQYHSWYNSWWWFTWLGSNDSAISTTWTRNKWWDISFVVTIDLSTWVCTYNITWPVSFSTTATLTSEKINTLLTYRYINFWVDEFTANYYMRLHTAELTIE